MSGWLESWSPSRCWKQCSDMENTTAANAETRGMQDGGWRMEDEGCQACILHIRCHRILNIYQAARLGASVRSRFSDAYFMALGRQSECVGEYLCEWQLVGIVRDSEPNFHWPAQHIHHVQAAFKHSHWYTAKTSKLNWRGKTVWLNCAIF